MSPARIFAIAGICLIALSVSFFGGVWYWFADMSRPPDVSLVKRVVVVESGWGAGDISLALKQEGLVRSALVFRLWVSIYGIGNRLKPGKYEITPGASLETVFHHLIKGREEFFRVTIPEGLTVSQISELMEAAGITSAASFTRLVQDPDLLKRWFPDWGQPINSGEGLLFPETYTFPRGVTAQQVAETLLKSTKTRVEDLARRGRTNGLSLYETCILASIVEREGKRADDKPLIASVFLNRLRKRIRLESCATVQFAQGIHKDRLLFEDLKIDSPYNTYLHAGLPPTPIANFGQIALESSFHPPDSEYFFFVSNASDGHYFSRNVSEHEKNKRQFFRERRRQKQP
jgi:UPF0755 protein